LKADHKFYLFFSVRDEFQPPSNLSMRMAFEAFKAIHPVVSNWWLMGGRGFLTMKWSHRIAQGFSP